jgi:glycosyltransferase involved in cell wall biosynthesis
MKVSVIIPVYNAGSSIARAVKSVVNLAETGEVILVDDGSADDSFQRCESLVVEYPNVQLLHHPQRKNCGASASRNLGLGHARNSWVQFLDADDELMPDKLAGNLRVIEREPLADMIIGNYIREKNGKREQVVTDVDIWLGLIRSNLGITSANLWRKEKLQTIGGWDETLSSSQEYDLMFRLMKSRARAVYDRSFQTVVHYQPNSISSSKDRVARNAINRIQLRVDIERHLRETGELTLSRKIAIHGFIYKNRGYLDPQKDITFRLNWFYITLYRILNFATRG